MSYCKLVFGFVEQHYDDEGCCTAQEFFPTGEVDRRDENDDPIDNPLLLEEIESLEKHCSLDMVQP